MISAILTAKASPDTAARVGRRKINDEQTPARFKAGTLARLDAALAEGEKRSDFIRAAVEAEIQRRESRQAEEPRGQ